MYQVVIDGNSRVHFRDLDPGDMFLDEDNDVCVRVGSGIKNTFCYGTKVTETYTDDHAVIFVGRPVLAKGTE